MPITPHEAQAVLDKADRLYSAAEVDDALDRLAHQLTERFSGSDPVVLCVMQGGLIPAGMLLPRLAFPLQQDYIHATRYAGGTRGGELHWIVRPSIPLRDRVVLIIDDIHDEGLTLDAIIQDCRAAGARAVYSAVLINKRHDRKHGLSADFSGLDVDDRYVFGFGMDYKGYLRNAAGIYAVNEDA